MEVAAPTFASRHLRDWHAVAFPSRRLASTCSTNLEEELLEHADGYEAHAVNLLALVASISRPSFAPQFNCHSRGSALLVGVGGMGAGYP